MMLDFLHPGELIIPYYLPFNIIHLSFTIATLFA